jgi:hypothetical protein
MNAVLVFSHSVTPRLQYIIDFLSRYYGLPFKLISNEDRYVNSKDNCKINYSYHRIDPSEIFIHSHALLFESFVRQVKVECFDKNVRLTETYSYKAFFKAEGDFGFDLFAAIFYLLTRYEEYLPYKKDIYGRYAHENSVAFREGFLHLPLINIWLEDFRTLLNEKNPQFNKYHPKFIFLPTYDIDLAWSFRNKGFKRNLGGILILLFNGKFKKMIHRIRVIRRKKPDPFDAYQWMDELHRQFNLQPFYFFLVAKEKGKHDKNIDVDNIEFQQLIQSIASRYAVGLHPSWASGAIPSLLTREKATLEQLTNQSIHSSRQHFIRFELPSTYRKLLALGITNDYSMGYGSINGFRASIATAFYWYDLKSEEKTDLLIHPFCFMDANAYYEQNLSPAAALEELMHYYTRVKSVNGSFITIWHNNFLGTAEEFSGWREMYEKFISAIHNGNRQS